MTKKEIEIELRKGRTLESILNFKAGQACTIFKADEFQPGDEVLYIPDIDLNEIPADKDISVDIEGIYDVLGCCYTGDDFIEACNGDEKLGERLFWFCDWQHPSSAVDELNDEDNENVMDEPCPFCGANEVSVVEYKKHKSAPYRAKCGNCGAETGYCLTEDQALRVWNNYRNSHTTPVVDAVCDDLYIVTENSTGVIYSICCKYALDLVNDWNDGCNFCPANDARVFFACWNGEPLNPHKYTDFQSLMENVLIPKFTR